MRPIGEIPSEANAKLLGDYLYVQGIPNDVEKDDGCWTLWIHDDDQVKQAEDELARFDAHDPAQANHVFDSPKFSKFFLILMKFCYIHNRTNCF